MVEAAGRAGAAYPRCMNLRALWPFRSSGIPTYETDNLVGAGTNVRGDLRGPGGFRVDGAVTGSVEADGPVVIGEAGSVEGSVKGRDVVVLGRVHGDVSASGHLEIGPKGRVMGDVTVASVRVHVGGTWSGATRIGDVGEAPRLATSTSPFGILPVGAAIDKKADKKVEKEPTGRTLPPPLGAVPPPPVPVPVITDARPAPRESGPAPIEPIRKAAAND